MRNMASEAGEGRGGEELLFMQPVESLYERARRILPGLDQVENLLAATGAPHTALIPLSRHDIALRILWRTVGTSHL